MKINPKLIEQYTYSTSENQIAVWTDGKPIYRKVLSGTTPTGTSGNIITNVSKVIDHHIMVKRSGIAQYHPLSPTMDNYDSNHAYPLFLEGTNIKLYFSNSLYQGQSYYGWVDYTKTTD